MALDRQTIERRDFPISRRGYDPDMVNEHLRALADEIQGLREATRPAAETLASAASEQVRMIVEAAETSAADIQHQAEEEAARVTRQAAQDAESARAQATAQGREHVQRVAEETSTLQQRLDAMQSELGTLMESLRTGAKRLGADLSQLERTMTTLRAVGEAGPGAAVATPPAPEPVQEVAPPALADAELTGHAAHAHEHAAEPEPELPAAEPEPAAAEPVAASGAETPLLAGADDPEAVEGARLIALNMALNGMPREEADRYLADNFQLGDRGAILDEIYARFG